jgi:hypothetical protein
MRGFAYSDKPDVAPEAGYTAWNNLVAETGRIRSICSEPWARITR